MMWLNGFVICLLENKVAITGAIVLYNSHD